MKKLYPLDYFIGAASLLTSILLIWAVLGWDFSKVDALALGRYDRDGLSDHASESGGLSDEEEGERGRGGGSEGGIRGRPDLSTGLQKILSKAHQGSYDYPTSFTQGIIPVSSDLPCQDFCPWGL